MVTQIITQVQVEKRMWMAWDTVYEGVKHYEKQGAISLKALNDSDQSCTLIFLSNHMSGCLSSSSVWNNSYFHTKENTIKHVGY